MPNFIADEHVPYDSINLLRKAGFTVISIREDYAGASDERILQIADEHSAIIITNDGDFGNLIFRDKIPFSAGLVYFRIKRFRPDEIASMLLRRIDEYGDEFEKRFTVISRHRFRQRPL